MRGHCQGHIEFCWGAETVIQSIMGQGHRVWCFDIFENVVNVMAKSEKLRKVLMDNIR
jgi:hypothetical protein